MPDASVNAVLFSDSLCFPVNQWDDHGPTALLHEVNKKFHKARKAPNAVATFCKDSHGVLSLLHVLQCFLDAHPHLATGYMHHGYRVSNLLCRATHHGCIPVIIPAVQDVSDVMLSSKAPLSGRKSTLLSVQMTNFESHEQRVDRQQPNHIIWMKVGIIEIGIA